MAFLSSASTTSQDLADTSVCFPCTVIVNVIGLMISLVHYINVSKWFPLSQQITLAWQQWLPNSSYMAKMILYSDRQDYSTNRILENTKGSARILIVALKRRKKYYIPSNKLMAKSGKFFFQIFLVLWCDSQLKISLHNNTSRWKSLEGTDTLCRDLLRLLLLVSIIGGCLWYWGHEHLGHIRLPLPRVVS